MPIFYYKLVSPKQKYSISNFKIAVQQTKLELKMKLAACLILCSLCVSYTSAENSWKVVVTEVRNFFEANSYYSHSLLNLSG